MKILMLLLCGIFTLNSCRQELLRDEEEKYDPNASKFQVIKLSDLPNVTKYVQSKTGRNDLKISIKSRNNNKNTKANIDFANLESSIILKKTEGEISYYVFNIVNYGDEKTIFNFEVKEVGGDIVSDKVLEYVSNIPYGENPMAVLRGFSGNVSAYSLDGKLIASTDFIDGENPCPPTYPPSSGNPPGGGVSYPPGAAYPNNPNPSYPSYPSYPSFPSFPSYPSDGGGSGGGNTTLPSEGCDNPDSYVLTDIVMDYGDGTGLGEYVNDCGWVMYEAVAYISANAGVSAKLTSPCDEGSGVIILPFPIKNPTPCDRIKAISNEKIFSDNITALEGNTGLGNETGYRMGYPIANTGQTGIQNQFLQNSPGTRVVDLKAFSNTFAILHTHYDGLFPIFSPDDIVFFNNWLMWAQNWNLIATNTPKIDLKNLTFVVVTSFGNYILKFDGTNVVGLPTYSTQQLEQLEKDYIDAMNKAHTNGNFDNSKLEIQFLKFVGDKMNMAGLKLYRRDSNGVNTEIYLENGKRKTSECS